MLAFEDGVCRTVRVRGETWYIFDRRLEHLCNTFVFHRTAGKDRNNAAACDSIQKASCKFLLSKFFTAKIFFHQFFVCLGNRLRQCVFIIKRYDRCSKLYL